MTRLQIGRMSGHGWVPGLAYKCPLPALTVRFAAAQAVSLVYTPSAALKFNHPAVEEPGALVVPRWGSIQAHRASVIVEEVQDESVRGRWG